MIKAQKWDTIFKAFLFFAVMFIVVMVVPFITALAQESEEAVELENVWEFNASSPLTITDTPLEIRTESRSIFGKEQIFYFKPQLGYELCSWTKSKITHCRDCELDYIIDLFKGSDKRYRRGLRVILEAKSFDITGTGRIAYKIGTKWIKDGATKEQINNEGCNVQLTPRPHLCVDTSSNIRFCVRNRGDCSLTGLKFHENHPNCR